MADMHFDMLGRGSLPSGWWPRVQGLADRDCFELVEVAVFLQYSLQLPRIWTIELIGAVHSV